MLIEIKHRWSGDVLFAVEAGSLKVAIELGVQQKANLYGANLREADLREANLYGADLREANLYRANLREANLYGANLREANLREADLREANLYRADLRGTDLREANLYGANLREANLHEADLRGTDLREANLRETKGVNPYRCTPLLMLLDQPGAIRAYKLVTERGEGPFNGGIIYEPGGEYAVDHANTDVCESCGAGINLATLDWCMKEWHESYRILIAEFTAAEIAAIPTATDGKFRVKSCRIVGEVDLRTIGLVVAEPDVVSEA
jgi:hypothetical protein